MRLQHLILSFAALFAPLSHAADVTIENYCRCIADGSTPDGDKPSKYALFHLVRQRGHVSHARIIAGAFGDLPACVDQLEKNLSERGVCAAEIGVRKRSCHCYATNNGYALRLQTRYQNGALELIPLGVLTDSESCLEARKTRKICQ